jgi:hypothetical protein
MPVAYPSNNGRAGKGTREKKLLLRDSQGWDARCEETSTAISSAPPQVFGQLQGYETKQRGST